MHGRSTRLILIAASWAAALAAPALAADGGTDPLTGLPTDGFGKVIGSQVQVRPEFAWPQLPNPSLEPAPMPPLAAPAPDLTAPVAAAPGPSLLSQQAASDRRTREAFQRRQAFLRQQRLEAATRRGD